MLMRKGLVLYDNIFTKLKENLNANPYNTTLKLNLLLVGKYLEKIRDNCCEYIKVKNKKKMSEENVGNRGVILIGGIMLQLCLGAVYAWSIFAAELKKEPFLWSITETQIVFLVALATFTLVMVWAGKWQDKMGPQKVALAGAGALGAGYILSGFMIGNFLWMVLTLGVIAGAGIGIGYSCPIAAIGKWFPDKLGLATGIAVFGFGAGAFFISVLSGKGIDMPGIQIELTQLLATYGLSTTLMIWGVFFIIFGGIGAFLLRNPPEG